MGRAPQRGKTAVDRHRLSREEVTGVWTLGEGGSDQSAVASAHHGASAPGSAPDDAIEQHGEPRAGQGDGADFGLRPNKAAEFQLFEKQTKAVALEPDDLDQIAASAAEDKDAAGEWALCESALDQNTEPVHAATHFGVAGGDPEAGAEAWSHYGASQALQDDVERDRVGGSVALDAVVK